MGWALFFVQELQWGYKPGTNPLRRIGSGAQGNSDKPSRYVAARRGVQHLTVLASGPASGRPWFPLLRDGDLFPYSMTNAPSRRDYLLASPLAASIIGGFRVEQNDAYPTHKPLQVALDTAAPPKAKRRLRNGN